MSDVPDMSPEEAWEMLKKADAERDLDDFRKAVPIYVKAVPGTTLNQLEQGFRDSDFAVHLIALEKEVSLTHTIVNLQGKIDCKYVVGFYFSAKPKRAKFADGWPASPEENIERLADAGYVMDRMVPKCINCRELGHLSKSCPNERVEHERVVVMCYNCNEQGHRARDCTQPRVDKFACRNCKQSGHKSSDCPEPRSAEGVECKRCNEMGHFAKDCPTGGSSACHNCGEEDHKSKECDKPRNMDLVTCRNCDNTGHLSKDCPEPKNWSKVTCSNCGENGHTHRRCVKPAAEADDGPGGGATNEGIGGEGDWEEGGTATGGGAGWESADAAPAASTSDW
ncbi:hypothetical protein LTR16_003272 [Cryomyces antarcticus]|uniref:CCHC-type domain-containing protein n=1 Tax=Cryomyces antarcticus TaxID=329879 RepID=A0ABR0LQA9_9PEZI|nr:hypothetical protein LTR60_003648 [Cryomyces antarcticus]KAK5015634.1 hypothetical protein LTR39_002508 [Cryomyces antarcticus]KAK5201272.1 hypothetical protein LTR16_003272 [Cryomyces antarcticus]